MIIRETKNSIELIIKETDTEQELAIASSMAECIKEILFKTQDIKEKIVKEFDVKFHIDKGRWPLDDEHREIIPEPDEIKKFILEHI